jgi:hypothetical protein
MGLAVLALVVLCSGFGGWDPVPAPARLVTAFLATERAEAAPVEVPFSLAVKEFDPLGDPDGFTDGPGGDPDGGSPPDSSSQGSEQSNGSKPQKLSRGLGVVAQAFLDWASRLF